MFEKEAIRHAFECTIGVECLNKPVEDFTYEELNDEQQEKAYDFQKGAEFGYNKAFVEADKNLKAIVTDFNKANKWHYVKDELPKTSGRYLVYTGGEPFILDFDIEVNSFGYWVVSLGDDWGVRDEDFETVKDRGEDEVIAWKEIVLPKEIKEND